MKYMSPRLRIIKLIHIYRLSGIHSQLTLSALKKLSFSPKQISDKSDQNIMLSFNSVQFLLWSIVSVLISSNSVLSSRDTHPVVITHLGKIQGNILKSRLNQSFYAFRGIRYGKAPLNELRFQVRILLIIY